MRDFAARPARGAGGGGLAAVVEFEPRAQRIVARAGRLGGRGVWRILFRWVFPGFAFSPGGAGLLLFPRTPVGELEGGGFACGAAFAGGGLGVDGFEIVFDDVGVNLGGLDAAVAEHFLDVADAGSAA